MSASRSRRHDSEAGASERSRGLMADLKARYTASSAHHLWARLNALDFINRGMLLAAVLLLCFFPFFLTYSALAGRSAVQALVRHLGLNQQAAGIMTSVFAPASTTSKAITGTAWVFFVLGGIAAASAIQELYETAYEVPSQGLKGRWRAVVWMIVLGGCANLAAWAGPRLHAAGGGVLLAASCLVPLVVFWWFSVWLDIDPKDIDAAIREQAAHVS